MNIFVTGGTGFIGSYVVQELVQQGHQVTVLARNVNKVSGFLNNSSIELLQGELHDTAAIERGLTGKDACIHIALGWGDNAADMFEADTKPSLFIFETAAKLGVSHLIYTSSTAAIGELREVMNSDTTLRPMDFYGATKAATEAYLLACSHTYGTRCNIIRPGYTFGNPVVEGAPMEPDVRFRDIIGQVRNNEPVHLIKNDGTQFIWGGHLAQLYAALVSSSINREIFLGLSKRYVTWEEIARYAIDLLGSKSEIVLEDKGWQPLAYRFDVGAMEAAFSLSFDPMEPLRQHIEYIARHS